MEFISIGLLIVAALNIFTYFMFRFDKAQAIARERRVPERTLLMWSAIGGSIGAKFAQHSLNHKTRRRSFNRWVNLYLFVHIMLLVLVVARAADILPPLRNLLSQ